MIRRRALGAGINAPIGNHSFRATGITAFSDEGLAIRLSVVADGGPFQRRAMLPRWRTEPAVDRNG
jgi:hypothetical protein